MRAMPMRLAVPYHTSGALTLALSLAFSLSISLSLSLSRARALSLPLTRARTLAHSLIRRFFGPAPMCVSESPVRDAQVALRQMSGGFGGTMSVELSTEAGAKAAPELLQLFGDATSLGGA